MNQNGHGRELLTGDQLTELVHAVDAVIDELHDDLVRRAIVHLTSVRETLVAAAGRAA